MRERLLRFNAEGLDGLGDRPGAGRKPRLTEAERSVMLALVATDPPGRLVRQRHGELEADDERGPARWTLDALAEAARARGIRVARSQVRRIFLAGGRALARDALLDDEPRPGVRPKRTAVVALYTCPPAGATIVCVDELGPVIPRTFPPAPGWSPDGHRIKAPLEYGRGPEKVWVYGALRERDGQAVTFTAAVPQHRRLTCGCWRRSPGANPPGDLLPDHRQPVQPQEPADRRTGWQTHPRVQQVFIPIGACWLNLQEAWWRLFRREAFAGQSFADGDEIDRATRVATAQLNAAPSPGSGTARRSRHATGAESSSTAFEERSTSGSLLSAA